MKVSQLAILLDSLHDGLSGILPAVPAREIKTFREAMQPFAEEPVAVFVAFLGQCEEYRRTGIVTSGKRAAKPRAAAKAPPDPDRVPKAVAAVNALVEQSTQGPVTQQQIEELLGTFGAFGKPELEQLCAGLNIAGKPKAKPDAIKKVRQLMESRVRMADHARAIREG